MSPSKKVGVEMRERERCGDGTNIDPDDFYALLVEVKECGPATSRCVPVCAFSDPSLFD